MDFNDTPEEAEFRAEAQSWLAVHAPPHELSTRREISDSELVARGRAWQRTLAEGGYAGILLPRTIGGRGGTIADAIVFDEEEHRYALPTGAYIRIGLAMAVPVIGKHGTPQQIERFVAPTLHGDLAWCQLFSEPGAGSDLAALRTRAVRDGDGWILNGQKVWSSWAHHADWGLLVARTDSSVAKHKGLTFFVLDMKASGLEVRPIRQISGACDFNETFFTDVRIPDSCRIGPVGGGWACCMTVLTAERLNQGSSDHAGVAALMAYAASTKRGSHSALDEGSSRSYFALAFAEQEAERHLQSRLRTMVSKGEDPGALASMIKLASASRLQKASGFAMELGGIGALATDPADTESMRIWEDYIWSSALRIAGGADEVLRNQISERVLGMPGEMRTDKIVPFDQLK